MKITIYMCIYINLVNTYLCFVVSYSWPFIPEQFTVKAHPALVEGELEGQKIEEHFPSKPSIAGPALVFQTLFPTNQAILFPC